MSAGKKMMRMDVNEEKEVPYLYFIVCRSLICR